jgi:hypothetical protein
MGDFLDFIVWSSLDNPKDNYLISKFNYLMFSLLTNMDVERQINMYIFMSIIFRIIFIQIKFDTDINNDELLETIGKHKKKRKVDHHY